MKPLVLYCRWHGAALRLYGRDDSAVWGELVFRDGGAKKRQSFRFDLHTWQLTLQTETGQQTLHLDEKGIVLRDDS